MTMFSRTVNHKPSKDSFSSDYPKEHDDYIKEIISLKRITDQKTQSTVIKDWKEVSLVNREVIIKKMDREVVIDFLNLGGSDKVRKMDELRSGRSSNGNGVHIIPQEVKKETVTEVKKITTEAQVSGEAGIVKAEVVEQAPAEQEKNEPTENLPASEQLSNANEALVVTEKSVTKDQHVATEPIVISNDPYFGLLLTADFVDIFYPGVTVVDGSCPEAISKAIGYHLQPSGFEMKIFAALGIENKVMMTALKQQAVKAFLSSMFDIVTCANNGHSQTDPAVTLIAQGIQRDFFAHTIEDTDLTVRKVMNDKFTFVLDRIADRYAARLGKPRDEVRVWVISYIGSVVNNLRNGVH